MNVSLTITQDWRTTPSNYDINLLFDHIELDCYGTDHASQQACRIMRGTTKMGLAIFCESLTQSVSDDDIIYLTFSH